jgi:hypothetical protein
MTPLACVFASSSRTISRLLVLGVVPVPVVAVVKYSSRVRCLGSFWCLRISQSSMAISKWCNHARLVDSFIFMISSRSDVFGEHLLVRREDFVPVVIISL